jgi:hypothetical protein
MKSSTQLYFKGQGSEHLQAAVLMRQPGILVREPRLLLQESLQLGCHLARQTVL